MIINLDSKRPKEAQQEKKPKLCVQLKNNRPWCPKRDWYMMEGCPFSCRHECDVYEEMCGAV